MLYSMGACLHGYYHRNDTTQNKWLTEVGDKTQLNPLQQAFPKERLLEAFQICVHDTDVHQLLDLHILHLIFKWPGLEQDPQQGNRKAAAGNSRQQQATNIR